MSTADLHDEEAERYVVGSMLMWPDECQEVMTLTEDHFRDHLARVVFVGLQDLVENRIPIDVPAVLSACRAKGYAEIATPTSIVDRCIDFLTSTAPVPFHLETVRNYHRKRRALDVLRSAQLSQADPDNVAGILDDIQLKLSEIDQDSSEHPGSYSDLAEPVLEGLASGDGNKRIPTGLYGLDSLLHGLYASELIYLAARPSTGKSALCRAIVRNAAKAGHQVLLVSTEVKARQVFLNDLSAEAEINTHHMRHGALEPARLAKARAASERLRSLPITVFDKAPVTLAMIRSQVMRQRSRTGISLLAVDYLQHIVASGKKGQNRDGEIEEISRGLKGIATEFDIPVLCLSQLNRNLENREDKRPRLADLRDSGSIEQDADVVIFLHRPSRYEDNPSLERQAECLAIVAKQRNGITGQWKIRFVPEFVTFTDWEIQSAPTYEEVHQWQNA